MSHPSSRDERRHQRERVIARRRFVRQQIWRVEEIWHEGKPEYQRNWEPFEWGRYAKFNMNCGCRQCHSAKYFSSAHKRRKALRQSWTQAEFRRRDKVEGR
jgi:hypothetical protein